MPQPNEILLFFPYAIQQKDQLITPKNEKDNPPPGVESNKNPRGQYKMHTQQLSDPFSYLLFQSLSFKSLTLAL